MGDCQDAPGNRHIRRGKMNRNIIPGQIAKLLFHFIGVSMINNIIGHDIIANLRVMNRKII
jgi:hypothetical protein